MAPILFKRSATSDFVVEWGCKSGARFTAGSALAGEKAVRPGVPLVVS